MQKRAPQLDALFASRASSQAVNRMSLPERVLRVDSTQE